MRALPTRLPLVALAIAVCALALLASAAPASAGNEPIVVNSTTDSISFSCDDGDGCTLRDAIYVANQRDGIDTISFSPGLVNEAIGVGTTLGHLPFIDASDGIIIQGSGQNIRSNPAGAVDFGLVFIAPYDDESSNNSTARNITVSNIGVESFIWDGIQVCAGFALNQGCYGPVAGVTIDSVNTYGNIHDGIRVLGTAIYDVSISNGYMDESGEDGISIEASSDLDGVHITGATVSDSDSDGVSISGQLASDISISGGSSNRNHEFGYHIVADTLTGLDIEGTHADDNGQPTIVDVTGTLSDFSVTGTIFSSGKGGIYLNAGSMFDGAIFGNTMSDHDGSGLSLYTQNAIEDVTVQGNSITGNNGFAIQFDTLRGGGNTIRNNTITNNRFGVEIYGEAALSSTQVTITRNSISGTDQGLGIDLDGNDQPGGLTPNDAGDGDVGPNKLLNFPVMTSDNAYVVTGTACANCLVELFVAEPDVSQHGEGKTFVSDVMADGAGNFAAPVCGSGLIAFTLLTATATDPAGNTSEFSANYFLLQGADPVCPATPTPSPSPTPTGAATPTPTPTGNVTPTPTNTAAPSPTIAPGARKQGDLDCTGSVNGVDAVIALRFKLGLSLPGRAAGCPSIGSGSPKFGDVNCDGNVDLRDALAIVQFWAGATINPPQPGGCTALGSDLP